MKRKRPARPRSEQREQQRAREKLWHAREKLALLEPGGSPERPLEVSSASVVEARAEAELCLRCSAPMQCREHVAQTVRGVLLRVAHLRCRSCGTTRQLYLRIASSYLN